MGNQETTKKNKLQQQKATKKKRKENLFNEIPHKYFVQFNLYLIIYLYVLTSVYF